MIKQGNVYYYSVDGLGSVVNLTDNTGTVVESYSYDEYGNLTSAPSQIGNRYLYTGREYDSETGLYYYRARYYDPSIGRFLQTDPIGYSGGINLYAYVKNNPITYKDPTGLKRKEEEEKTVVFLEVRAYRKFRDFSIALPGVFFYSEWELYAVEAYYEKVPKDYELKKTEIETFYENPIGIYDYKYENIWSDYGPP